METSEGFLLIDKPVGPTSHDVIDRVRAVTGQRKAGHAGTLDPLASGLLIIGLGPSTKLLGRLSGSEKSYEAILRLGQTSPTDDAEGELTEVSDTIPTKAEVESALTNFRGQILQTPPVFSARKVAGRRSYQLAREGKKVELEARPVTISELRLSSYTYPELSLTTTVSSGTYIRSLARDLGTALGTGAHLTRLRRTAIGPVSVAESTPLDGLKHDGWVLKVFDPSQLVSRFERMVS